MASLEIRGDSVRVSWLLGGRRGAAKQSCTFTGPTSAARLKLALAAKSLAESRGHDLTRDECYRVVLDVEELAPSVVPTFAVWAEQWIAQRRELRDIEPDGILNNERTLRARVIPFLGHKRLTDIDRDTIKAWVRWMSGSKITLGSKNRVTGNSLLSARSIRSYYSTGSLCLAAAVPKWIPVNPAARVSGEGRNSLGLPRVDPHNAVFLTAEEIGLVLQHCSPDFYDLVYVALRTGMRLGELVALEAQDVLFPRGGGVTVQVRRALKADRTIGRPKSPASVRSIPVSGKAAQILARRVAGARMSAPVFTTGTGRRWGTHNMRQTYWHKAVAAARRCPEHMPQLPVVPPSRVGRRRGLRVDEVSTCDCSGVLRRAPRFHDLRHTHASALIAAGWHAKKIQVRLGHSSFQVTMDVYGHLMDNGAPGELDLIEEFLEPRRVSPRHVLAGSSVRRSRRTVVRRAASRRVAVR
jgi:integrase